MNDKNPSLYISEFLNFIARVEKSYNDCVEELKTQDKLTQDYLHSLELDDLKYEERNKIATQLSINRKDRRYFKDRVEEYKPIVEFMSDPNNKRVINNMKKLLGEVRKEEAYHKDRVYIPKVLKKGGK